jgi:hypothetical protein
MKTQVDRVLQLLKEVRIWDVGEELEYEGIVESGWIYS